MKISNLGRAPFDCIGWAMAEFHKGERRQAARARRDNARRRQEARRAQRDEKSAVRATQF